MHFFVMTESIERLLSNTHARRIPHSKQALTISRPNDAVVERQRTWKVDNPSGCFLGRPVRRVMTTASRRVALRGGRRTLIIHGVGGDVFERPLSDRRREPTF
jgi:hypothetical protein